MYEKIWILLGAVVVLLFIPQMKVYATKSSRIETVDYTTIYQGKTSEPVNGDWTPVTILPYTRGKPTINRLMSIYRKIITKIKITIYYI